MPERPDGFYWVRDGEHWAVARWDGISWEGPGWIETFQDSDFDEIGERVERGAVAAEREACAKLAEYCDALEVADRIRERK